MGKECKKIPSRFLSLHGAAIARRKLFVNISSSDKILANIAFIFLSFSFKTKGYGDLLL